MIDCSSRCNHLSLSCDTHHRGRWKHCGWLFSRIYSRNIVWRWWIHYAQMHRLKKTDLAQFCDTQTEWWLQIGTGDTAASHTLSSAYTPTRSDFPPDCLSSTVKHMSFVCRPSSTLTERHLETLISWSHPSSALVYSQTGVPALTHLSAHTWIRKQMHNSKLYAHNVIRFSI